MNEHEANREDREIALLLEIAGPAPDLPEEEVAPIRAAAQAVWRRQQRGRVLRRRAGWVATAALAASLALVVATRRSPEPLAEPREIVATVALRSGDVLINGSAALGASLLAGSVVETSADGALALSLVDGASVRLASATRLLVETRQRVVIEEGAVYIDSGNRAGPGIAVASAFGVVTEIGTQFEVRLLPPGGKLPPRMRVRVREGQVRVEGNTGAVAAQAGDELVLGGPVTQTSRLASDHPDWEWAARAAPAPQVNGRPLPEFLDWVAREMGVVWRSELSRKHLEGIVLHGSLEGLTPREALDTVLTGSDLTWQLRTGVIEVGGAPR
jgi:hypothetical protein